LKKGKPDKMMKFTQDSWNPSGGAAMMIAAANGDFQKMLQLENIKKGMARKSSKENSKQQQ
jgi:hypothetical protein